MRSRILIVEDKLTTKMDIEQLLKQKGFKVVSIVSSGEEAIKKSKEISPDLVLMNMPLKGNTNCIDAARKIMADLGIPIIFSAAYSVKDTLEKANLIQHEGFIHKSFTPVHF